MITNNFLRLYFVRTEPKAFLLEFGVEPFLAFLAFAASLLHFDKHYQG
jgi:hypothetical protein